MKALIADDDVFVRKCLIKMLPWREMGFSEILEAQDGTQALRIALEASPDLIISDVKMPGMTGLELARKLRASMVDVWILVLSEYSDFEFVQTALQTGVQDYILKPITRERLAEIGDKIGEMTALREMKHNYAELQRGEDGIRRMIRDMLSDGDAEKCADAFEYAALNRIPPENLKYFGASFLSELFAQTESLTARKQELSQLRENVFQSFERLKNVAAVIACVKKTCQDCLLLCARTGARGADYVQQIDDMILKDFSNPDLSVTVIAERLHLSAVYTGTLYKQHTGSSIIHRINDVRLQHAREMLLSGDKNIRVISREVGYVTPDYFSRLFNSYFGISPTQYRMMMLQSSRQEQEPTS